MIDFFTLKFSVSEFLLTGLVSTFGAPRWAPNVTGLGAAKTSDVILPPLKRQASFILPRRSELSQTKNPDPAARPQGESLIATVDPRPKHPYTTSNE